MAQQEFTGGIKLPEIPYGYPIGADTIFGSSGLGATLTKHSKIFLVPQTGDITAVCFKTGSVTTAQPLKVGLQTINAATGNPSGTWLSSGTVASPAANIWYEVELDSAVSINKADIICLVIEWVSATGNLQIMDISVGSPSNSFPYINNYASSTWGKLSTRMPQMALKYGNNYANILGCLGIEAVSDRVFNSQSSPNEYGIKFKTPFPMTIAGFWVAWALQENPEIYIYDYNGNLVGGGIPLGLDKDIAKVPGIYFHYYTEPVVTVANEWYRLTVKPLSTGNITLFGESVNSSGLMETMPCGSNVIGTSGSGTGTDMATWRPKMGLIVNGFDDAA